MNASDNPFPTLQSLGPASAYVDRIMAIVGHIRVFGDFDRPAIEALAAYMQCYRAPAGCEVLHENEAGDFMLLILEGRIEITRRDRQGLPMRLAVDGPGKTLGEMSLIDGEPRFASCVTLEPTQFAVLDRTALSRLVAEQPQLGVKFLMELLMLLNQRLRALSGELMKCLDQQRLRIR